jgi:hypothetical protein
MPRAFGYLIKHAGVARPLLIAPERCVDRERPLHAMPGLSYFGRRIAQALEDCDRLSAVLAPSGVNLGTR